MKEISKKETAEPLLDIEGLKRTIKEDAQKLISRVVGMNDPAEVIKVLKKSSTASELKGSFDKAKKIKLMEKERLKLSRQYSSNKITELIESNLADMQKNLRPKIEKIDTVKNRYIVGGKVIDRVTKVGLPGLKVSLSDPVQRQGFKTSLTNENGIYRIELTEKQLLELNESQRNINVKIFDDREELVFKSSKSVNLKPKRTEIVNMAIDANKVPEVLKHGIAIKDKLESTIARVKKEKELLFSRRS